MRGKRIFTQYQVLSHKTHISYKRTNSNFVIVNLGSSTSTGTKENVTNDRAGDHHTPVDGMYLEGTALFLGDSCRKCITQNRIMGKHKEITKPKNILRNNWPGLFKDAMVLNHTERLRGCPRVKDARGRDC